jgi:hypothetical protein
MWLLLLIPAVIAALVLLFGAKKSADLGYDIFNLRSIPPPSNDTFPNYLE